MKKFDYIIGGISLLAFFILLAQLSSYFDRFSRLFRMVNISILAIFVFDVLLRAILSKNKAVHIKNNFIDFIVFVPFVQFIKGFNYSDFSVIVWQIVIIAMLVSRVRKVNKFVNLLSLRPAQLMIASFAFVILSGTILLMLPMAAGSGVKTPFIDALFTATSATCVTGLIVKDTASYYSLFGQMVILSLIQIGGLGIMTFSVSLSLFMKKQIQVRQQIVMKDVLDQDVISTVKSFILFIVKMTFMIELAGAVLLFSLWREKFMDSFTAAYHAVFHSISAFCNAGFSTFSDSLMRFSGDGLTNSVISLLIIVGGLGFIVIRELFDQLKNKFIHRMKKPLFFRVQTKIVLGVSLLLIVLGSVVIYLMEKEKALSLLPVKSKILISLFQSVTTRTAGFNTVDLSTFSFSTLLFMMILMFIGGSPGSTAGGVKTTTISVLWATLKSSFNQKENVELSRRTLPNETVQKAITIFVFSLFIVGVFASLLLYFEQKEVGSVLFETVSAFGTVGLSTGITPNLTLEGKILISLLMFVGRIGPLTLAYAIIRHRPSARYRYAEERVMIG
ncbi:MAG: TrkH family potassium uptake protein [Candidatus Omnitrophota bacterium]